MQVPVVPGIFSETAMFSSEIAIYGPRNGPWISSPSSRPDGHARMGREPLRCRERREAHYKIRNDACERKPLSAAELNQLFLAVDKRDMTSFGVRKLADVQLNGLQAPPPSAHLATPAEAAELMEAHTLTVLSYAAWRRRDQVVKSLLIAGADPTVCEARPGGAGPEVIRAHLQPRTFTPSHSQPTHPLLR